MSGSPDITGSAISGHLNASRQNHNGCHGRKNRCFQNRKKPKSKNRLDKPVCTPDATARIEAIRRFYRYKRGFCPAELLRQNINFLSSSRTPDFHITPGIRARSQAIYGQRTGYPLKPAKDALRLRGVSAALLKKVPIRTRYTDEEGNTPGFRRADADGL